MLFNLPEFISRHVTGREKSLFDGDVERYAAELGRLLEGRSVLVIGGAGTIGSAFIKAILPYGISRLYVVDNNENALTELTRDLRSGAGRLPEAFVTYPVDFSSPVFEKILRHKGPFEIVANFAAHKHVRSEKDHFAVEAMIGNNVLNTAHLLQLLAVYPPERFFCVSTDKAADPVNVMGATKKLMEQVILAHAGALHVSTARFANVAFSNGSLPAGFLERITKRQALSTPGNISRYFLSPEESGQLCMLACVLGSSGEIFFPKLEEGTDLRKFSDIAIHFLQTLGMEPDFCHSEQEAREKARALPESPRKWPVYVFYSETTGEKEVEQFFTMNEHPDYSRFMSIGVISPEIEENWLDVAEMIQEIKSLFQRDALDKDTIIKTLKHYLPEFRHQETGRNLDQQM